MLSGIAYCSSDNKRLPVLGYVKNIAGLPVYGARVMLINEGGEMQGGSDQTFTSNDGLFQFINKTEGLYTINVYADGYHSYQDTVKINFDERSVINIVLTKSKDIEEKVMYLGKNVGKFNGTVIADENDEPLSDALVVIDDKFCQTNESGNFKFNDISIGEKKIKVTKNYYEPFEKTITIMPKSQTAVIRLVKIESYATLLGRVRVETVKPYECPPIKVYFCGKTAVTDYKGNFKFTNIREGSYPIILIFNKKELYNSMVKVTRGMSVHEILLEKL
ncbi:MAG: carboxypeptidase regulatory-like domain-containing protein [Candidatus Wallbacteria bacterium]